MREIVRDADLPEPDEVRYAFDPDEVHLLWNEPKLAVVVDLEDEGPEELELGLLARSGVPSGLNGPARSDP